MCACHSVVSDSLRPHGLQPIMLLCPWDSPGRNTEVSFHSLLQGIFPIQGLSQSLLCLLHGQVASLSLIPPGKYLVVLSTHAVNYSHGFIILPNLEAPSTHLIPRFFEGETQDLGHLQSTCQITPVFSVSYSCCKAFIAFFSIEG